MDLQSKTEERVDTQRPSRPFAAHKPSGVPWLGDVPAHWEVRRLKHAVEINPETLSEATDPEYAFDYMDINSVGPGYLVNRPVRQKFGDAPSRARRVMRKGDTAISTVRTYLKAAYHLQRNWPDLIASTGFAVLRPPVAILPAVLGYIVQSHPFIGQVMANSVGIAYPAISETKLGMLTLPLPPLAEQAAIVRYLDWVDRRVRRYVGAKERLIGLLEEEKQAIINRAVTRGLDPSVRLKPSGVEWLGDVPEHWEVRRLKRVLHRLIDCEHKTAPDVSSSPYRVVRTSAVRGGSLQMAGTYCTSKDAFAEWTRRGTPKPGDVIFTREAPAGEACVVPSKLNLCLGQRTVLMKVDQSAYDPQFLVHMLYAGPPHDEIELASRGSTVPHFNVEDIGVLPVLTPPVPEQKAIVRFLDQETTVIDTAIGRTQRQIELVEEYRTRLIADVVTGKLDVREAAAQLPGATEAPDGRSDYDRVGLSHEANDQESKLVKPQV